VAQKILILGESGSGKTTSIRNLNPKETYLINCIGKNLPFKGWRTKYKEGKGGNLYKSSNWEEIVKVMHAISETRPEIKTIIVDDAQYVMLYEFMARAKEKGYDKFTEMAQHVFELVIAPERLRDDLTVIYLWHSEDIYSGGTTKTKVKTVGKMLDEKLSIEGLFTIVLLAGSRKGEVGIEYVFLTNNDGSSTAKSPDGLFDSITIDNDLSMVLDKIKQYEEG
jgi:hypothetical protein